MQKTRLILPTSSGLTLMSVLIFEKCEKSPEIKGRKNLVRAKYLISAQVSYLDPGTKQGDQICGLQWGSEYLFSTST